MLIKKQPTHRLVFATIAVASLTLTACASTSTTGAPTAATATVESTQVNSAEDIANLADITQFCPTEPMTVGFSKGKGDNWTKIALQEMQNEADKCGNISIKFTDAQGSGQKIISDVNAMVAENVDAIVSMPEFGEAQIPSLRAAVKAGIPVVTLIGDPGGTVGTDVTDKVHQDFTDLGQRWADFFDRTVKSGNVAFLGGTPGAPSSKMFFDGFKAGLAKYPNLKLTPETGVDTNWDSATKKRTMAGLLAKYGDIQGIASDSAFTDLAVLDAYEEAGKELPALAGVAATNGNGCRYLETNSPMMSIEGTSTQTRVALRKAVAAAQGKEDPEPSIVKLFTFFDTSVGKNPPCKPELPADADLSTSLSEAQVSAIFGG